ncbi:MAG: aminotransferase class V-fold PLP-dependent enzyme [Planctomycetes bacterium]|nr:aminotransferase class V-fold PLP-dependent enzyme [Planctomycetota bacterium]
MQQNVRRFWTLDERVTFLNHGSFGACPIPVQEEQTRYRMQMEREPVRFMVRELPPLLDAVRTRLAEFLRCDAEGLALIPNATTGVNTVLRSLQLQRGDELLVTDHEYNACRNALNAVAKEKGATVVVAYMPFPVLSDDEIVAAILERVSARTKFALVDHVTSPTGIVLPVERLARELARRGVPLLVDGAHAPGMLDLDLAKLAEAGVHWYTGNCHKWMCTPKGSALLYVRADRREGFRPLVISHGANASTARHSRFRLEFDWGGTLDPTSWLAIPKAIDFLGSLLPGGWPELREKNHALAIEARELIAKAIDASLPAPAEMLGSLASIPLPPGKPGPTTSPNYIDPLGDRLLLEHGIEVPIFPFPAPPSRLLRVSAQIYNRREDYERLAAVLPGLLKV